MTRSRAEPDDPPVLMREYRLRLEITAQAHDDDEALAMAYGALDAALLREATEELPIRPKPIAADRVLSLAVDTIGQPE